jgi:tripartite-type tricarboxylate transporter receptor subunit TctC
MSLSRLVSIAAAGLMVLNVGTIYGQATSTASGQAYPSKPIRIVTGGAGGGNDFTSRQIAQGISGSLGQPIVVDNRAAPLAIEIVSKAPPDGYSLLVLGTSLWLGPLMQ